MTSLFLIQLLNGMQLGILLFLIGAGLTLIFGIMDFVNLAHGVLYMLGAYFVASFAQLLESFWLALLLTLPATFVLGLVLEMLVLRHLYQRSHLTQVLATFGLLMIGNESVKMIWGTAPINVAIPAGLSGSIELLGIIQYPVYRLAVIAVGILLAVGLFVLINHTRVGMLLRAGASNRNVVSALGVNIHRLFSILFACGAMLAGLAGALVAPILSVTNDMGDNILILAFVVIVIGGVGSVRGALLAALLVGFVDTLGRTFGPILLLTLVEPRTASQVAQVLAPMLVYILMALVLFSKPTGLFGRAAR